MHPVYDVQDWDSPQGSIDWGRMVSFLAQVRETGVIPIDHRSHDHLNEQKEVPVAREVLDRWKKFFADVQQEWSREGEDEEIVWGLVDGFLLYWNMVSGSSLFVHHLRLVDLDGVVVVRTLLRSWMCGYFYVFRMMF